MNKNLKSKNLPSMLAKKIPSDRSIIECLKAHYDIEIESLSAHLDGADINAATYKAYACDHAYFVKLKQDNENGLNLTILELLHKNGIQQIIPPVKTINEHLSQRIDGFSLSVYPFVEGINGFNHKLTENQWIIFGKALRQVHDCQVPGSLLKTIRQESYSPKWRDAARSFYASIENKPLMDDAIARDFIKFMKENKAVIHGLVDQAEKLGDVVKNRAAEYVLCHSDIHGGNVLIKGNDEIYMVDWDDPIRAPKERDLMFIGGGVANVWNDPKEALFFYQGYGNTNIDISILAYYRCERIVEDIAEFAQIFLTDFDCKNRSQMYQHFLAMFASDGVVDIAFKTVARCYSR